MKPSTNFKIIVGIFLVLFAAGAFYMMATSFSKQSGDGGLYDRNIDKKIIEDS